MRSMRRILELYRAAQAGYEADFSEGQNSRRWRRRKRKGESWSAKKKRLYGEYQKARRDMQEVLTIKANIDCLLGYSEPAKKKEMER